jgi:transcriptional regulator with XRE-family HTH domain
MAKKFNKEKFAKDIVLKRVLEKRISLRKAAKECDVHFSNLSRYERQEFEPTISHLINVCNWLGTKIEDYLID